MDRRSRNDLIGNAIVYSYPHGEQDIVAASNKVFVPEGYETTEDYSRPLREGPAPSQRVQGKKSEGDDMQRSMRRARANLRRLALANDFRYFVTLTLDKEKIDRYDGAAITKKLNMWCSNMVSRHKMLYVIVPEQHQDGAWHFHGLVAGDVEIVDSGTIKRPGIKKPSRPASEAERAAWLNEGGQVVYNLPQWSYGFSTAMELHGEYGAAVAYVCKYIGKQQGQRPLGRWYYSGGALEKPRKDVVALDYGELAREFAGQAVEFEIPGSKLLVIHAKSDYQSSQKEEV